MAKIGGKFQIFWRFRQPQVSEGLLQEVVLVGIVVDVEDVDVAVVVVRECQGPLRLPEEGGIEVTTAFGMAC